MTSGMRCLVAMSFSLVIRRTFGVSLSTAEIDSFDIFSTPSWDSFLYTIPYSLRILPEIILAIP
jgi:hypothetical protein